MSSLLIFGAGGHGKVVADTASVLDQWEEIVFADDRFPALDCVAGYEVVANFSKAMSLQPTYANAIVAIGDNLERVRLTQQLISQGFNLVTLIHPSAVLAESSSIDRGSVILASAVVQVDARVGVAVILNTAATVDHDCVIADGVHLSPGVHLGGDVQVGENTWLGIGAVVLNGITIGRGVTVGAGAVVTENIPDDVTAVGMPAKVAG